jgi:hypothetical protein
VLNVNGLPISVSQGVQGNVHLEIGSNVARPPAGVIGYGGSNNSRRESDDGRRHRDERPVNRTRRSSRSYRTDRDRERDYR